MLSILSWNIRQGGGTRVLKLISKLSELGAEIVILSEFKNNEAGIKLRTGLLKAGYRYQNVSGAPSSINSAAIFSKMPCDQLLFPDCDDTFPHNIVASKYAAFQVYGMYLPHKKKHQLFDFLLEASNSEVPGIMAGDFNSGINGVDQAGKSFWYEDKLKALAKNGYVDAFRLINGDKKEYSWYSHQGNGYRYDHTYIHESLIPITKECYYLHEWREQGLSDHSPMMLKLG